MSVAQLTLRRYQQRIVKAVGISNAIIKMPTGSGKTIVAAGVIQKSNSNSLFLVPTIDLVSQQANVLEAWTDDIEILQYCGGMADPSPALGNWCIVSTPQSFISLQGRKADMFNWDNMKLVVFDEVHHVLKEHPYRIIALTLRNWQTAKAHTGRHQVQVVGMSASLTYHVNNSGIQNSLNRLCHELRIENMISPTVAELIDGGYIPQHGNNVEVEKVGEVPDGVVPASERKPHEMHKTFLKRIGNSNATPFTLLVSSVVKGLERMCQSEDATFQSPLKKARLKSWETYANDKFKSTGKAIYTQLEDWYVAMRILAQTWEEEEQLVLQWLSMTNSFDFNVVSATYEIASLKSKFLQQGNFLKLDRLRDHLIEKRVSKGAESFRCIVFVQQRITAVLLAHYINNKPELTELGLKAGFVASRDSQITPSITMSKKAAAKTIQDFRNNTLNVLVATSVIEEGFDVPAANVVISFDYIKNSVELCQRFGRARQQDSSVVVLDERSDRPMELLESVRETQETIIQAFDPTSVSIDEEVERKKQTARECGASTILRGDTAATPIASLNIYVRKTKAVLQESHSKGVCVLKYSTILRTVRAEASGSSKKLAKRDCASVLLYHLKAQIPHR